MSSSLPPYVSGLIRGHVDLSVSNLEWTDRRFASPHAVFLVQWWGQKTWSTIVRYDSVQNPCGCSLNSIELRPNAKKTASFEIRCGMKQFSAYLADIHVDTIVRIGVDTKLLTKTVPLSLTNISHMGSLVLKCVKAPGRKSFGVVRISDIASLVNTRNISR